MSTSLNLFDLRAGKVLLDRYHLLGPHRDSGIAATFAAEDAEDGSRLELLAFPGGLFEGHAPAAEFADRLTAWHTLRVDGVQAVLRVEVLDDGAVLLITDFPPGHSLRGWMNENTRMGEEEVVILASGLLAALREVHHAGLVHGDIKPAAIFYQGEEGVGTLVDGGLTPALWSAKHLGTRTALIGTPFYAPLEQFTGDSPDELSDLYNLATVMYELLSGVLPWSGKGYIEVFQSKMQASPPQMSMRAPGVEVNAALEAVIATGLRAERRERYQSAESFLDALGDVDLAP